VLLASCTEVTKVNVIPYTNDLVYTYDYVDSYREITMMHGITSDYSNVEFQEGVTSNERSVQCNSYFSRTRTYKGFNEYEHKLVVVDVDKWNRASYLNRMDDVYHSLSVCVYGAEFNSRIANRQYVSLLAVSSPSRYDEKYVNDNWDVYVKELMGAIK